MFFKLKKQVYFITFVLLNDIELWAVLWFNDNRVSVENSINIGNKIK